MTKDCSTANKGVFSASVGANRQIGQRFYRLGLCFEGAGAKAFAKARPGQFAELDLSNTPLPRRQAIPENLLDAVSRKILLRRPFSFAGVTAENDKVLVDILYCAIGPGSLRMTMLSQGDSVSIIGPLGNNFSVPKGKKSAVLVAGGMGAGPLIYLAKVLTADYPDIDVIALAGAKTAEQLPFEVDSDNISAEPGYSLPEFAAYKVKSIVATDDGSAGFAGTVTAALEQWLRRESPSGADTIIYSCGPETMLGSVAEIAQREKIDCQVSMERMMACGIGLCQSCAVECRVADSSETVYKMCCKDGPVFDSSEVVF